MNAGRFPVVLAALLAVLPVASGAPPEDLSVGSKIAAAAERQVGVTTRYDPSYVRLDYPGGDLPLDRGVCADVVVRAFRAVGVDLQVEVHRDMLSAFSAYPDRWGLHAPDSNIDHRRVPNLMTFLERTGHKLDVHASFEPGDVVAWSLPGGLFHIGIVSSRTVPRTDRPLMVHNIGYGAQLEDVLHAFPILGHYRW